MARAYLRVMEWVASRAATRVIADAQAIADRFVNKYPRCAPCSFIAYGAEWVDESLVDPGVLARWELQPYRYALVVARPEPENHIEEIIRGYVLHGGAWPLVVVGGVTGATPYQRRLLAMASDKIRFVGGVYDAAQLQSLRVHAGCYLHGHSVGGTNPSLLEALACGNWVIAHDNPYNREVARDAAAYFKTPEQLAHHLSQWVGSADGQREERSRRARQIVARHYTWEGIVDAYETLMREECSASVVRA